MKKKLNEYEVSCNATLRCLIRASDVKQAKKKAEKEMVEFLHFMEKCDYETSVFSPVEKLKVEKLKEEEAFDVSNYRDDYKECGNCGREATHTISENYNRCDRCASL